LVGEVTGSNVTGQMELTDHSGRVAIAPVHTAANNLLTGFAVHVLVTAFDVIAIKHCEASETRFILSIKELRMCDGKVKSKTELSKLTIEIVNKNEPQHDLTSNALSFTALARVHGITTALKFPPNVFKYYSYINNGYSYEISSDLGTLPSSQELSLNPSIVVTAGMRFHFIKAGAPEAVQDVVDLVSCSYLPAIPTIATKPRKTM